MANLYEIAATSLRQQPVNQLSQKLTARQLDVLALMCEGLPNKLIGRKLKIANGTVKIHVANILRALNVTSRLQAVIVARGLGADAAFDRRNIAEPRVSKPSRPVELHLVKSDDVAYWPAPFDCTLEAVAG